uniref:Ribosomal protein S24/S35 mitochondrial conserved domain-containing protein n=1 Tax=Setaria digitata TaxID=48799 RepID=A0A915PSM4_9BILA
MRFRLFSLYLPLHRHFSVTKFDGKIPLDSLHKTVTFREDQHAPQVELRIPLDADWIPRKIAEDFRTRYSHRIDRNGQLVIESCRTYSEQLNMADCIDKLRSAMLECQAILDGERKSEGKLDPRTEAMIDIKRRLAAFESEA